MCVHDRLTSYLNFESGLVEKDCFFMFIIFNGRYLTQICHKWRFQKILSNFELVMNFGNFGQTTVDDWSLWIVYETFRWSKWYFVVTMWCTMTTSHASHDAKRDFGRYMHMLHKWTPKFELLHDFLETKTNQIGKAWCKHHFTCVTVHPCAKFEAIWTMLGESMVEK